jgi:hypothetical protein
MKVLFWIGLVVLILGLVSLVVPIPRSEREGFTVGGVPSAYISQCAIPHSFSPAVDRYLKCAQFDVTVCTCALTCLWRIYDDSTKRSARIVLKVGMGTG